MEMGWILGGFFVFLTFVYLIVALFFPEWVGIQGKAARKIEESHRQDSQENDSNIT